MRVAYCSTQLIGLPAERFRLIPAGVFRAIDGRPQGLPGWTMDAYSAQQIIDAIAATGNDVLIDFDHQSLGAQTKTTPSPAAGWFKTLAWIENDGLYVTDARWTDAAIAMIRAKEYRYISPVFRFDPSSGRVSGLISAAITNTPALPGLTDLAACRAQSNIASSAGVSTEDRSKLQHVFGVDFAERSQQNGPHTAACAAQDSSVSENDRATLDHVFSRFGA